LQWEIFSTLDTAQAGAVAHDSSLGWAGLDIALPPTEDAPFQEALLNGVDDIMLKMGKIDARDASAYKPEDEKLIYAIVAGAPGGFEHVNSVVHESLQAWVMRCSEAALAKARKRDADAGEPSMHTLRLFRNLGRLLREHGDAAKAQRLDVEAERTAKALEEKLTERVSPRLRLRLFWRCSGARGELSEPDCELLLIWEHRARLLLTRPNRALQATDLYRGVLRCKRQSSSFGPDHASTLVSTVDLANAMEYALQRVNRRALFDLLEFAGCSWLVRKVLRPARARFMALLFGPGDARVHKQNWCVIVVRALALFVSLLASPCRADDLSFLLLRWSQCPPHTSRCSSSRSGATCGSARSTCCGCATRMRA
jgi:hypothetical protein